LPQHTLDDVVLDVLDPLVSQLAVAQTAHGVVLVQALLGLGGGLDVPLDEGQPQRLGHFLGQHRLACARFAFDQQRPLEGDGCVDRQFQVLGGYVMVGTLEFHGVEQLGKGYV